VEERSSASTDHCFADFLVGFHARCCASAMVRAWCVDGALHGCMITRREWLCCMVDWWIARAARWSACGVLVLLYAREVVHGRCGELVGWSRCVLFGGVVSLVINRSLLSPPSLW
jgi:hypothetical protein